MTTQTDRRELIRQNLKVAPGYSVAGSRLVDRFQELTADIGDLTEGEQAKLISAMLVQLSGKLSQIHGN